jgi:hypothetical protein
VNKRRRRYLYFCSSYKKRRESRANITGPLLKEEAIISHKIFNEEESGFTSSTGWADRCGRGPNGVSHFEVCGEKLRSLTKNENFTY